MSVNTVATEGIRYRLHDPSISTAALATQLGVAVSLDSEVLPACCLYRGSASYSRGVVVRRSIELVAIRVTAEEVVIFSTPFLPPMERIGVELKSAQPAEECHA
jgi:hypothetical protein